ncbi:class E sortase [Streptomyces sp. NBC_01216]|uniref:class E sortase n=1 Tax=unclassified Streptomyces TaxID=2593676 RepID=UPI002E162F12|nr:class E sortase [Streptomyces sp. NBC_01216]
MRYRGPVVVRARGVRSIAARALWAGAETVVTCGVVLLLLVAHQLWWTNREARADARRQVRALERAWGESPSPGAPGLPSESSGGAGADGAAAPSSRSEPPRPAAPAPAGPSVSASYAVLRIPRIGLTAPVAQGVGKASVLDKGYVGHYPGTAAPGRPGNVALAGHRNTHGEPFRHLDRLERGDEITVRTREATYTYRVDQVLPRTAPRDTGVIAPVPRSLVKPSYGYSAPGSYLTLTTCTPEFSSSYRLVVWARLVPAR